MLEGKAIDH